MDSRLNLLWIGLGSFGKRLLPYVEQVPGIRVIHAHENRGFIPEEIRDPAISAVFITTPNDQHAEYLELALQHQKHVFVEKPITARLQEALCLEPLVTAHRGTLMVGHNMRRGSGIRTIKKLIGLGAIGSIVSVRANYSKGIAFTIGPCNWRFSALRHREGPLITVGIHLIDILHYLCGPIDSVSAILKNISGKTDAPDSGVALMNFKNGITAFLETNYNTPSEEIVEIHGTEGSLLLNRDELFIRKGRDIDRIPSIPTPIPLEPVDTLSEEVREFFQAIKNGGVVETGFHEAVNALAVVEACFQSSHQRQIIHIKNVTQKYFAL